MPDVQILVVDDRREDLLAIESLLADADYTLVTASSGTEALRRVLERDFAVILLDVLMPMMDGFEVARIIKQRERSRDTPIIFLTAAGADVGFIYRGYSVGAVDYLTKPLDADVVKAKIGIFVELYRRDQRIKRQAEALLAAGRRERELELAELRLTNERRYRNLAEAVPHIVWTADAGGAITYFNQRWFEYSGQSRQDADGDGWQRAVHLEDATRYAESWRGALADLRVFELEVRLRDRDGAHRWHLCRAVPELGASGQPVGWLGTFTDFDDRKRALDAAEQAVHVRDEFLSIAAHELRTPLMTLQLRLHTLEDDLARLAEPARDALGTRVASSLRQCQRLADLVERLLDVARISSGRLNLRRERFELGEAAREVTDRFAELAQRAHCKIQLDVQAPASGCWDRLRVEQILGNLLGNAIKYAPGSPIDIVVAAEADHATVAVRDRGMGIPAGDLERIFGQFQQSVPARQYGGLGLGLFITRQIALAHGGQVRAQSEPGLGSTFVVELPLGDGVS